MRNPARPVASSTFSVIGADVAIKGDVEASADLHVDGTVVGDLVCASLVQGETSRIEGGITADTACEVIRAGASGSRRIDWSTAMSSAKT